MRLCKLSEICGFGLLYLWVLHLQVQLTRESKHLCVGGCISIEHILTSSHYSLMQKITNSITAIVHYCGDDIKGLGGCVYKLYANSTPSYERDLSICGF